MEIWFNIFASEIAELVGPDARIFPLYMLSSILLAYLVYASGIAKRGFFSWVFSPRIWLHKSSIVDMKLFFAGRVFAFLGLFNAVAVTSLVTAFVLTLTSGRPEDGATSS